MLKLERNDQRICVKSDIPLTLAFVLLAAAVGLTLLLCPSLVMDLKRGPGGSATVNIRKQVLGLTLSQRKVERVEEARIETRTAREKGGGFTTYMRLALVSEGGIVPITGFNSGPTKESEAADGMNRFLKNPEKGAARVVMKPVGFMWIAAGFLWFVAFGMLFEGGRECFIDRTQGIVGLRGPKYRTFGPRVFPIQEVECFVLTNETIKNATIYGLAMRLSTGEEVPIINGKSASNLVKKQLVADAMNAFHKRALREGRQLRALDLG